MLERAGYELPPHMMNVRLVHLLDDTRRKELMFIYAEAADAFDEGVIRRAKERIRLSMPPVAGADEPASPAPPARRP
jgi:hypothetical protein